LSAEAKAEWSRITPELERLGLIARVDRAALAGYAQSWARWREAEQVIEEHGQTYVTPTGFLRERPEVAIAASEKRALRLFALEFGLSPASRTRLPSDRGAGNGPPNPFEEIGC
jgi:P27 family predicted phage terminase small subunit